MVLAVIAAACAAVGFGELAGGASVFAKIAAFPALALAVILLIAAAARSRTPR